MTTSGHAPGGGLPGSHRGRLPEVERGGLLCQINWPSTCDDEKNRKDKVYVQWRKENSAMKMPPAIDTAFFAPCGMNCIVCYKHCYVKKPCAGCFPGDDGKPEHCRKCKIKDCIAEKNLTYCFMCDSFPCKLIKNLGKSYKQRYGASLVANSLFVKEHGLTIFMEQQLEKYTCPGCGGIVSIHDAECSECQAKI